MKKYRHVSDSNRQSNLDIWLKRDDKFKVRFDGWCNIFSCLCGWRREGMHEMKRRQKHEGRILFNLERQLTFDLDTLNRKFQQDLSVSTHN